jgi:peptidoglycan L-alanyl-D-glutamate endopeptidase CwlK
VQIVPDISVLSKNNQARIATLHPEIRDDAIVTLSNLRDMGINVEIVSTVRTFEEQDRLYSIGRDADGNEIEGQKVVTYAKAGQSYHNYGLAFDVEVYTDTGKKDWDFEGEDWQTVVREGTAQGFTSGSTFTGLNDYPHFENSFGNSTSTLKQRYDNGQTTGGFVNVHDN